MADRFKTDSKYSNVKGGGHHGYSKAETESAMNFCNHRLAKDPDLKDRIPLKNEKDFFEAIKDGILLNKLINIAVPGTVDSRSLNVHQGGKKLNPYQIVENHNLAIGSARGIGASIVNIGPDDISKGTPHLCLGLTWQVIKIGLMQNISLKEHPELIQLLEDGETLDDLLSLPPEKLLIRWVNYQMKKAGSSRRIKNFGRDIKDGEVYTILLNQVSDGKCSKNPLKKQGIDRARDVLKEADKIDCNEFVSPKDIVDGNERLNFCFVANIFNKFPHLDQVTEEEMEEVFEEIKPVDDDSSREERNFKNWISSLGFEISDLYTDLSNGLILLKLIDLIKPGTVDWRIVNQKPTRKRIMTCVGNCALAVKLSKEKLGCSLVSIGGSDIAKKNKKLTLGLIWQLMKCHYLKVLTDLGGGKRIGDRDLIKWANEKNTTPSRIRNMRDKDGLRTGEYFCFLVQAINPKCINEKQIIRNPSTEEEMLQNASLAISCSRKIGATIFLVKEDIVEVKEKMIMTFIASLMAVEKKM